VSALEIVAVYLIGLALLVADLFLGSMAVAALGIIALCVAAFGAFSTGGPLIGTGVVLATAAITWIAWRSSMRRLAHKDELTAEDGYVSAPPSLVELKGQHGTAETPLRPAGFARIGGKRVDVVTRGELVETGVPVEVIQVEGARVVVKARAVTQQDN
jgi:membrane-bound serine protease (ClpP class)